MSEYFFRRYRNGERMAEDVRITQAATLEEASLAASRIVAQYNDGTVLVSECEVDLRAELAAERELREREKDAAVAMLQVKIDAIAAERESAETYKRTYMELHKRCCGAVAERDALREQRDALRRVLERLGVNPSVWSDAALNKGGGDV